MPRLSAERRNLRTMPVAARKMPAAIFAGILLWLGVISGAHAAGTAGHPDFSGMWMKRGGRTAAELAPPPLTPGGAQIFERNRRGIEASDPNIDFTLQCMPTGFPRSALSGFPFVILQTPTTIGIVAEGGGGLPQMIYMDRKHEVLWPTFMGDAVGHWEGETLVVDVVGLTTKTFFNSDGLPHSDSVHIVERMSLIDGGKTLRNEMTIDDPEIFVRPWLITLLYDRTEERPTEAVCENPRLRP